MSRIDDALKRLAGVTPTEGRVQSVLERFAPEERAAAPTGESLKSSRREERKVASFVAHSPQRVTVAPPSRPTLSAVAEKAPSAASGGSAVESAAAQDSEIDTEPLVDVRQLLNYAGFVARSVRRHPLLAIAAIVLVLAMTGATAALLPRTYHVQTKLLAQRNAVMAALSNPGRAIPWDADAPTRAAAETVLRRDNLIALITQTNLMKEWELRRAPILKFKDWLVQAVMGYELTEDEKLDRMIGLLESQMAVQAGPVGDGTVTIDLHWRDGEMAYRLVEAAKETFLEARQVAETAAIGESITILERYSETLHENLNRTLVELERTQPKTGRSVGTRTAAVGRGIQIAAPVVSSLTIPAVPQFDDLLQRDPELTRMKATLTSKRQELGRIEETRQRQLTELQAKLGQLRTVYTPNHPSVLGIQQNIAALSQESPQALSLAAEIEELQADHDKRIADAADEQIRFELAQRSGQPAAVTAVPPAVQMVETPAASVAVAGPKAPSQSDFAALRLRSELSQLESVLERTDAARIELAVSQAAFKYRYSVIRPPQIPREPVSPNVPLIIAAGVIVSLLLALGVTLSTDVLSNRILEPWQIERQLALPVLGTLRTV